MPNYRRVREGNTYFFTVVTYNRQSILCLDICRNALREVMQEVRTSHPFKIEAWVLLPDHIHCIWQLPEGDKDYSMRWGLIKKGFTQKVKNLAGTAHPTLSRQRHREGVIWQRRFWEHQIRDERDFAAHCDYIHYNPVKHGLVKSPKDWEYSTFHRFIKQGMYTIKWGMSEMDFSEGVGNEPAEK